MGRAATIARRTFLVGITALAGGAGFGIYAYRRPAENPLLDVLGEGEAAPNPFIRIDAEGVTVIAPRADSGQGVRSALAALAAEELDVALEDLRVEPGEPSPAYYNGAVIAEGFPFAATDDGFMASGGRVAGDAIAKFMGVQITGGSTTVADGYVKLRVAGAVAREVLKAAAARRTGRAAAEMKTENGAVVTPEGEHIPYGALAAEAARIEPPTEVALRPASAWRLLGKPMRRVDIVAKSTGRALYGIDLEMEGMLHATAKTNPRRGGEMRGYDAAAAEAMRGVKTVVPIAGGVGIIADNTWRAFQAAEAISFDWGPAPYPADTAAMFEAVAAAFDEDHRDSRLKDEGDVEAALTNGAFEAEYRIPYLAHAPLEPLSCVARLTDDRLDIWAGTQIPLFVRASCAEVVELDEAQVHVHDQFAGGSFGRRLEQDFIRQAVEIAKAMKGTPVKMTWTREEDMTHDFPRPLGIARGRGVGKAGRVEALDLSVALPSVSASQFGRLGMPVAGPDVAIVAGGWDQPYGIPDYRVTGYRVPELAPVSSWRSVGASANGFFHECLLDELIHEAGGDPMAERLRLCWHEPSRKVLEAVAEMSGWGSEMTPGRGRGVAFTLSFGVPVAEVVEVTDTRDGIRIDRVFVAADVGRVIDPANFENQLAGGVIWGLGHAMNCEITYADGMPEQMNFYDYEGMSFAQAPEIHVRGLENGEVVRGIGEPGVPPAAPALANAIFAATGRRIRELPLGKQIDFA